MSRVKASGWIVSLRAGVWMGLRLVGLVPVSEHKRVVAESEEFRISSDIKHANLELSQALVRELERLVCSLRNDLALANLQEANRQEREER